ncbi:hypothetical protein Tco_0084345 [Tanacetum coccineum]
MDATGGRGSNSPVWPIVDDNNDVDMDATMDNLEDRISNLENVFAYLKNKKMVERKKNKPNKEIIINQSDKISNETPSFDDTTDEDIAKFKVAAKSKDSTSKPKKVITHKVVTQKYSILESRKSAIVNTFTLGTTEEADNVKILQSCNGLLMCSGSASPAFYYVYNPCTNLFKRLSQPEKSHDDSYFHLTVVLRMTFDLRKSLDYKVVLVVARLNFDLEIQVYSSETGN